MRYLAVLALALSACAVNPEPFQGPSGKQAYFMKCSGGGRTLHDCFAKAGELCPGGYQVVNQSTGTVAVPVYGGGMVAAPSESLAVECR